MGGFKFLPPFLALLALSHGAALPDQSVDLDTLLDMFTANIANLESFGESMGLSRNKRAVGKHVGFKTFGPVYGVEGGLKYTDPNNKLKGGEVFLDIADLKAIIPKAHSNKVELHAKFDGGAATTDGIFTFEIDYHLTHSDGEGVEEGQLDIIRQKVGGKWETEIKTSTKPFSGTPIIPAMITNADFGVSSDWTTFLSAHYVNAAKNRDMELNINRIPGKEVSIVVKDHKKDLLNQKLIIVDGSLAEKAGTIKLVGPIAGTVSFLKSGQLIIDLNVLQIKVTQTKKATGNDYKIVINTNDATLKAALKSTMGINKLPINMRASKKPGAFKIAEMSTGYGFSYKVDNGLNFKIEQKKVAMWEYHSEIIKNINTPTERNFEAKSSFTLNPSSKLYELLSSKYPLGAFNTRENYVSIYVDRAHKNKLLPKFKIHAEIKKDSAVVFDLLADTTHRPYEFKLDAPNLRHLLPFDRQAEGILITVDHDIGHSLNIKSNGFGELELEVSRQHNTNGGWDINAFVKRGGVQMIHYDISTHLVNDATQFNFGYLAHLDVSPNSLIYKNVITKYKILTPFNKRTGQFDIVLDKVNKNVVFNKFKVHGKADKDGVNVIDVLADFTKGPYEIKVFAPAFRDVLHLEDLTTGTAGILVTIDHHRGDYLEIVTNLKNFSGLKITTVGATKELEFNGVKVGSGEFQYSDKKIVIGAKKSGDGQVIKYLKDGDNLKAVITWTTDDPRHNEIKIDVKGNKRNLDFDLKWDFSNLDFDISTPSSATVSMKAVGNNPVFGAYKIIRDASLKSAGQVISLSWTGNASFQQGPLAPRSPIITDFHLDFDATAKDLTGKISKTFNGKEYSVTFPKGTGLTALPKFSLAG